VALSYVWGVSKQEVCLTKKNLDAYSKPGGIPKLSQTVEDAIHVTKSIGIRYFWCDVISIVQDDREDKAQNISDMDVVYTYSSLTIVAAAGKTCHEGLYGVSRDRIPLLETTTRSFSLGEISDQPERPHGALAVTSGWPSRAWTLQEFLLSRQALLFCKQQIIWMCRGADWAEELDIDGENFRFADYRGLNKPEIKSNIFADRENKVTSTEPSLTALSDAVTLIECYTERKLTDQSDISGAFEGLMWYMSSMSPLSSFLWGLPELNFEAFLCWTVRDGSPAPLRILRRREEFPQAPSWSWMAWLGSISLPRVAQSAHRQGWRSFIKCHKYPTYRHRQGREFTDICSGYEADDTVLSRNFDLLEHNLPLKSDSASLVFWGECATIVLDSTTLEVHHERGASSINVSGGKRLQVQRFCIWGKLAARIRNDGVGSATLVAVLSEGNPLAVGNSGSASEDVLPKDSPSAVFELWDQTVHCLVLSFHESHASREGMLSMKAADWLHLEKETKLVVLD